MVAWYQPVQLVRTGLSVLISKIFGRNADPRLVEALKAGPSEYFDYTVDDAGSPRTELWLDYVADTGDGFNSTYAIASALARPRLELTDPAGARHATERGRVLVFGGDQVYPVASNPSYEQRLVLPYELAMPDPAAPPADVYAIPGNHDWYDSLVAFTRVFCSGRWFAGWRTHQRVSYFALQLPHDWWLVATDIQLDSDIDRDQLEYFEAIAAQMGDHARVILCTAEPHWIYQAEYSDAERAFAEANLRVLEDQIFGGKIAVSVSGDLHHYRRHSDDRGHHKLIAGGGGAFLHPTHDRDVSRLPGAAPDRPFVLGSSYPDIAASRALTRRNFLFMFLNLRFGLITAALYVLTCRAINVDLAQLGVRDIARAANLVLCAVLDDPAALIWVVAVTVGVVLFTDSHSKRYRLFGGLAHATAHLASVFVIGWAASWLVGRWHVPLAIDLLLTGALVFAAGWIVGSLVLGTYLFVSLNWFGRHSSEAFSSLAIPDWKNFLRLHVDAQGALRIYPIGIDRVPRRWRGLPGSHLAPDDPRATPARLIELPIVIPYAGPGSGHRRSTTTTAHLESARSD
jgi:hypothetical protein